MPPMIENLCELLPRANGTSFADNRAESCRTAAVRRRLETKNDESRFGLTRAPLQRRGSLERGQSLARHRAAQSGNRKINPGTAGIPACLVLRNRKRALARKGRQGCLRSQGKKAILFAAFTEDSNSQWLACSVSWQLALLAFIYGAAVMAIVIVTLMKSARKRRPEARNKA
jgi:hypothetical protein